MMYEGYDEERIGIAPEWAYTRIRKLEALLNEAYPFIAGHNWNDCDCIRCAWIGAFNGLMGGKCGHHLTSPQDAVPAQRTDQAKEI